jgi:Fe/S biogenesis protein NfuA
MIEMTEAATKQIAQMLEDEESKGLALRISAKGIGAMGHPQVHMQFVPADSTDAQDSTVEVGTFLVIIDADSAPQLEGASIDFVDEAFRKGFKIDFPSPTWDDPIASSVQKMFDEQINPGLASHGGWVQLLDVKEGTAYIALGGGCVGCGMANVTLKQGIEAMLVKEIPEIKQVLDKTDHASGTNPYYQTSKGSPPPDQQSPLAE